MTRKDQKLITSDQAAERLGISRQTLLRRYKIESEFPQPAMVEAGKITWLQSDIDDFKSNHLHLGHRRTVMKTLELIATDQAPPNALVETFFRCLDSIPPQQEYTSKTFVGGFFRLIQKTLMEQSKPPIT